jgi:hypothetical protein
MKIFRRTGVAAALLASTALLAWRASADPAQQRARQDGPLDRLRVEHVLLLSVDGLHQTDADAWIRANPGSALAQLSRRGVVFRNARAPVPSDSFPGLLALVTGGTPKTTGVYYDDSYDRTLHPPGSNCQGSPGAEVVYDETIDKDLSRLFSGGIAPEDLPLQRGEDGVCRAVYPHQFLRVNTIFEVIREAGRRTAWSDKHPSYDLVNGPSGVGVDDLYTPEINSNVAGAPVTNGVDLAASLGRCDATNSLGAGSVAVYTDCGPTVEAYDDVKVQAVLNQIRGRWSTGAPGAGVPAIFGMNFQAVSVGQKLPVGGYGLDGAPSALLAHALAHTDASLGRIVNALDERHLLDRTLVIVTAKHGQSPVDPRELQMKSKAKQAADHTVQDPLDFVNAVAPEVDGVTFTNSSQTNGAGPYATQGHLQTDDVGILWLQDRSELGAVVAQLTANAAAIHAGALPPGTPFSQAIVSGVELARIYGDPSVAGSLAAARAPDVFIQPDEGVIYSSSTKKIAEHGGGAPADVGVALIVSNPGLHPAVFDAVVHTTQVAPTILQALRLDPERLQAVRAEGTRPLPLVFTSWTLASTPAPANILGGPWTLSQAGGGPLVTTAAAFPYAGYPDVNGSSTSVPMQPYYFPLTMGDNVSMQGLFDYRPKDLEEAIVSAFTTDGGRSWTFQGKVLDFRSAATVGADGKVKNADDDGQGHPQVIRIRGVDYLYTLDRSSRDEVLAAGGVDPGTDPIDNSGLIVHRLTPSRLDPLAGLPASEVWRAHEGDPSYGVRTTGLLQPDAIFAVVPEAEQHGERALVIYCQKDGSVSPKVTRLRLASTEDGVRFVDHGALAGLTEDLTFTDSSTDQGHTVWIGPRGSLVRYQNGQYGMFFSGGTPGDQDSDAFHYVGYAETASPGDLLHWNVVNGLGNPILSRDTTLAGPQGGAPQPFYQGRVYAPNVTFAPGALDGTLVFAGYNTAKPKNNLSNYRTIGVVTLRGSRNE